MKKKLTRPDFLFVDVELDFRLELDFRTVAILNRVCVGGTRRWRPLRPRRLFQSDAYDVFATVPL